MKLYSDLSRPSYGMLMAGLLLLCAPYSSIHAYQYFEAADNGCTWSALGSGNVDFLVDSSSTPERGAALLTEVTAARDNWNNIGTANDVLGDFTLSGVDYDDSNFGTAWGMGFEGTTVDNQNEVVLDETGDILTNIFGLSPARINGFGPSVRQVTSGNCIIVDAFNLLNDTRTNFDRQSTTVHEFGHIQGLAHSSVGQFNSRNNNFSTSGYASPSAALVPIDISSVPTMHPFSTGTGANRQSPEQDDIAGLSGLNPAASFSTNFGSIAGSITRCSDDSPLEGVNVRAVNTNNNNIQITRYASFDSNGTGSYLINGLPPGNYHVVVEPMGFNGFTKSRMAIQTNLDSGFPTEYYGPTDAEEMACTEDSPDSPLAVTVTAGTSTENINLRVLDGTDLAFVVDDTGSMGNEISAVRDILNSFIDILETLSAVIPGLAFPDVAIVTFKDNVLLRTISNDPVGLRTVVDGLRATGGGDCPESSNSALLEAGRILRDGGVSILFTDADSRPNGPDRAAVLDQYRSHFQTLSVLLSSSCSRGSFTERFDADRSELIAKNCQSQQISCNAVPEDPLEKSIRGITQIDLSVVEEYEEPPTLGFEDAVVTFSQIARETGGVFVTTPRPTDGDALTRYINTGTNISVSSVVAATALVTPSDGPLGATVLQLEVSGANTNWNDSSTVEFVGTNIAVLSSAVNSATSITIDVSIPSTETVGFYDVVVETDLGGGTMETATGIGAFQVTEAVSDPQILAILPGVGSPGDSLNVTIDGINTSFDATSVVDFNDPLINVNSLTAETATRLIVNISIDPTAPVNFRNVVVDGIFVIDGFLVTSPPPVISRLVAVTPNQIMQGDSGVSLTINGENTTFDSSSVVSFSGDGFSLTDLSINSGTELVVIVDVAADAALGFRDVLVSTGDQSAALLDGLQVVSEEGPIEPPERNVVGYKWYFGTQSLPFNAENPSLPKPIGVVSLSDRFGTDRETVVNFLFGLANSTGKNSPRPEIDSHLTCYSSYEARGQSSIFLPQSIAIETIDFGGDTINIGRPLELCVSALKEFPITEENLQTGNDGVGDFKCYSATSRQRMNVGPIVLEDQFGTQSVSIRRLSRFCTPVGINQPAPMTDTGMFDHIACYDVRPIDSGVSLPLAAEVEDPLISEAVSQDVRFSAGAVTRYCEPARVTVIE